MLTVIFTNAWFEMIAILQSLNSIHRTQKKLDVRCLRDLLFHYFRELNGAGHQSPLNRDQALKNAVAYLEGHLSDFLNSIKNKLLPSARIEDAQKRLRIEPAETWAHKMLDWTLKVIGKLDENQKVRVESVILNSAKQYFGSLIRQGSADLDANARPSGEMTTLALPLAIWLADHNQIRDCLEFNFRGQITADTAGAGFIIDIGECKYSSKLIHQAKKQLKLRLKVVEAVLKICGCNVPFQLKGSINYGEGPSPSYFERTSPSIVDGIIFKYHQHI